MADYKKIDLQIGTEEQFEEKKLSLPVGTLVGITDPIHESELDTDLQTKINEVNNRLTKPTNPSAESAVTMLADGTVGTKPLTSITGKTEVYVGTPDPTGGEILWIDPNGTSGGGGSGGGKLYRHLIGYTDNTFSSFELVIYLTQKNTSFSLAEFIAFTKEKNISYCLSAFSIGESGKVTGTYYLPGLLSASSDGKKLVATGKKPGVAVQDGGGVSFNVTLSSTGNQHFADTVTEL